MTKNDVIKELSERIYGNTYPEEMMACTQFYEEFVNIFTDALIVDGKVVLSGFLTATVKDQHQRTGVDPRTLERKVYPATTKVVVKLSDIIKKKVREYGTY